MYKGLRGAVTVHRGLVLPASPDAATRPVKAPAGAEVAIHFDGQMVEVGDALVTPRWRGYVVISVRRQARGKHEGRQHVRAVVVDDMLREPFHGRLIAMVWHPRAKAKPKRRRR